MYSTYSYGDKVATHGAMITIRVAHFIVYIDAPETRQGLHSTSLSQPS
jgi:hypothetical protein